MTTTTAPTNHQRLRAWVDEWAAILQPDAVEWCDGSDAEYAELCRRLVDAMARRAQDLLRWHKRNAVIVSGLKCNMPMGRFIELPGQLPKKSVSG